MRGMYTAGVLDVFIEHDITFDGVIGVSAGAIVGCSYISRQLGRTVRYNRNYCRDKRFMSFYSLLTTGDLVGADFCYRELPEVLDPFDNDAFMQSETAFYVTCTNLETGGPEYIRMRDMAEDMDYMRASASMPYVSHIVEKGGMKLLDGGCSDSVPVRKFMEMGYEKNVVVLTRPADYRKKEGRKGLAQWFYRKYPKFAESLLVGCFQLGSVESGRPVLIDGPGFLRITLEGDFCLHLLALTDKVDDSFVARMEGVNFGLKLGSGVDRGVVNRGNHIFVLESALVSSAAL